MEPIIIPEYVVEKPTVEQIKETLENKADFFLRLETTGITDSWLEDD